MPNEGYVYFGLYGEFDPAELTGRIGVEPTRSRAKGSRSSKHCTPRTSIWQVSSERVNNRHLDIEELAIQVVETLKPKEQAIKDAIAELGLIAVLQVVICFSTADSDSTPSIGFSRQVLEFVVEVGGTIDIDSYLQPA